MSEYRFVPRLRYRPVNEYPMSTHMPNFFLMPVGHPKPYGRVDALGSGFYFGMARRYLPRRFWRSPTRL